MSQFFFFFLKEDREAVCWELQRVHCEQEQVASTKRSIVTNHGGSLPVNRFLFPQRSQAICFGVQTSKSPDLEVTATAHTLQEGAFQ